MFMDIILLVILVFIISIWRFNKKPHRYPPGPISFPVIGHLGHLAYNGDIGPHELFIKWGKRYNSPIVSVDFASYPCVVINDYKMIREAWNMPQMSGRLSLPAFLRRSGTDGIVRGLVFNEGQNWIDQRRFTIRTLKEFGFGKSSFETIISDEINELINDFKKDAGQPISTSIRFNPAVINSIWILIAGYRFKHDDPKLKTIIYSVMQNLSEAKFLGATFFMPWLSKLVPDLTGYTEFFKSFYIMDNFMKDYIDSRLDNYKEGVLNDFTDAYIHEIKQTKNSESSFYKEEGAKSLQVVLGDLFVAGGETTSTILEWTFLCLALNPKIQDLARQEIFDIIGKERKPEFSDKQSMPYVEALTLEVLRISSIVALGVYHRATEDINFNGFFIPINTVIMSNLHAAHHDPKIWNDPEIFRPERFLSLNGKNIIRHDAFLPFSIGKRVCPGEAVAKDFLFLSIVSILQTFLVLPDPSQIPQPTLEPDCGGMVCHPKSHKLVFQIL